MLEVEDYLMKKTQLNLILEYSCYKYLKCFGTEHDKDRIWLKIVSNIAALLTDTNTKNTDESIFCKICPKPLLLIVGICSKIENIYTNEQVYFIKKIMQDIYKIVELYHEFCTLIKYLCNEYKIGATLTNKILNQQITKLSENSLNENIKSQIDEFYNELKKFLEQYVSQCSMPSLQTSYFSLKDTNESFVECLKKITMDWIDKNGNTLQNNDIMYDLNKNLRLLKRTKPAKESPRKIAFSQIDKDLLLTQNKLDNINDTTTDDSWTKEENKNLIDGVEKYGKTNWNAILKNYKFNERNIDFLKQSWEQINKKDKSNKNTIKDSTKKWSKEEEANLMNGVGIHGTEKWTIILNKYNFQNRTAEDLQEKWKTLHSLLEDSYEENSTSLNEVSTSLNRRVRRSWKKDEEKNLIDG
ncbi:hypothetical protein HZS_6933, partial [Henneguya salminicola]